MLQVVIPETEFYDESSGVFISMKRQVLQLEHSLVSLSKWESKWQKPFLTDDEKTEEESLDYFRCMTLTKNVPDYVYQIIPEGELKRISEYISSKQSATVVHHRKKAPFTGEIVTSELIYYWMVALQIPFECEKWHLNRLLMLIQVCNAKNNPEKMSRRETLEYQRSLNAVRRAKAKKG